MTAQKDTLVGKFFLGFNEDGHLRWQGVVTAEPAPGFVLIQFFDFIFGQPRNEKLITVEQMVGWTFYDDADDWREAADSQIEFERSKKDVEGVALTAIAQRQKVQKHQCSNLNGGIKK